jgi:gas vesicle protein
MATTAGTRSTLGSARGGGSDVGGMDRDEQYDLLTAALIGVAVGAGTALLLSALAPERPVGVRRAMRKGRKLAARGGKVALGAPEAAREQLGAYLESAREAIADTVEAELKDLRRAIRRRRRRLGL